MVDTIMSFSTLVSHYSCTDIYELLLGKISVHEEKSCFHKYYTSHRVGYGDVNCDNSQFTLTAVETLWFFTNRNQQGPIHIVQNAYIAEGASNRIIKQAMCFSS